MKAYEIKPNGFCNGVKRAIKMIKDIVIDSNTIRPIYMLGYLVHNKNIINSFIEDYGIILITSDYEKHLKEIKKGTIIFTAHGISPSIKQIAIDNNLNIVDTTCPNVLKIQKMIKDRINENYNVLVVGSENHPETKSYLGISKNVQLYNDNKDYSNLSKIFVINQTTLIYDDVLNIFENIKKTNKDAEIAEEICNATKERQKGLLKNIDKFDCYIIIGDRLSNNCDSLYRIAINHHKDAFKIESAEELNYIDLSKYNTIGVTAGASTPSAIVREVITQINSNENHFKTNLSNKDYIDI